MRGLCNEFVKAPSIRIKQPSSLPKHQGDRYVDGFLLGICEVQNLDLTVHQKKRGGMYMKGFFRKTLKKIAGIAAAAAIFCPVKQASANVVDEFSDALKSGTPTLELRLGYEYSNYDDNNPIHHPANGINLRTRVGYRTGDFLNTSAYIQLHNVTNFMEQFRFPEDFPTKISGDKDHDVIADPDGSRVHQAYLDFKFIPDTVVRLGRQEIILDDHRLIGNINWRQNGQSFDAVSVTNKSIPDLVLFASYINQVETIFLGDMDLDGMYLFHATYKGLKDHSISAFCYLLDTESEAKTARDSATYGLRVQGKFTMLNYYADYAHQEDYQDGENHDGDMFNAFVGAKVAMINGGVGYSYLSGQDGDDRPFDTLFSTAHKFNGWADQFLATNTGTLRDGLQDFYVQLGTNLMGIKFMAVYHYFDTAENDAFDGTYGDEIDLLVAKKFTKNLSGLLKYAYYSQDDDEANGFANPTRDEEVFWARLQYNF